MGTSHLVPLTESPEAAWYAIADAGEDEAPYVDRYVVSTEPGRVLLNQRTTVK